VAKLLVSALQHIDCLQIICCYHCDTSDLKITFCSHNENKQYSLGFCKGFLLGFNTFEGHMLYQLQLFTTTFLSPFRKKRTITVIIANPINTICLAILHMHSDMCNQFNQHNHLSLLQLFVSNAAAFLPI